MIASRLKRAICNMGPGIPIKDDNVLLLTLGSKVVQKHDEGVEISTGAEPEYAAVEPTDSRVNYELTLGYDSDFEDITVFRKQM